MNRHQTGTEMADHETRLLNDFIDSGVLCGWFIGEFPVQADARRKYFIDMICVKGIDKPPRRIGITPPRRDWIISDIKSNPVWLLEAKTELNPEAIGQVLVYKSLFRRQFQRNPVEGIGIVTRDASTTLRVICGELGIRVFIVPGVTPHQLKYDKEREELNRVISTLTGALGDERTAVNCASFYLKASRLKAKLPTHEFEQKALKHIRPYSINRQAKLKILDLMLMGQLE